MNQTTMAEYCKVVKLEDVLPEFLKWKNKGMVRRRLSKIDKKMSRPYNNEGLEEVIEWRKFHYLNQNKIAYEDYKTWPDVGKFLSCFYQTQCFNSKDHTERYFSFQLKVSTKESFEEFKNQLDTLIPHTTYTGEDGFLYFDIFEHTCSEHGSYGFWYNPKEDKHRIDVMRYHRNSTVFEGTLKECFDEIQREYYYER